MVPGDAQLEIRLGSVSDNTPQMSCDSQVDFDLREGDCVRIRKYPHPLQMIYPSGHSFYETCRSKLDWGSRLANPNQT